MLVCTRAGVNRMLQKTLVALVEHRQFQPPRRQRLQPSRIAFVAQLSRPGRQRLAYRYSKTSRSDVSQWAAR
ncbi:hypothetical protein BHE83_19180 [Xanthomonas euvesicatoria pv. vesicatoria str. 85-10]|nr:hypothetical protein BHE83_19180 [Xanthomonas euvesicatoria pv. vesicatoria str. 85-10]APO91758.1 hypothetical protein BJD11_18555 [Xanthomonas euvesicatoria]